MDGGGWLIAGRYRVVSRIGAGATAEVFRARDETLGRDVAVKVFRTLVEPSTDPGGSQRQEIELHALAQLSHPNLIAVFDGVVDAGSAPSFLVMELVEGECLAERLAAAPLPEAEVRETGAQLASALAYIHARGMVHRDVKPANILLGADGADGLRARLSDFGIVRMMGSERVTAANLTLGTPQYLAPEQARGSDVGPAADVYALGLVTLEMLTGKRSYDGAPVEAAVARLVQPPVIPSSLDGSWAGLLHAMTTGDPSGRPQLPRLRRSCRAVTRLKRLRP